MTQVAEPTLNIPALYTPHSAQRPFHRSTARFKVLVAGRRFGKDRACIFEMLQRIGEIMEQGGREQMVPPVLVWVVAPTYPMNEQLWAELKAFIPREVWAKPPSEVDRCITLLGGAEIWMKTAAEPERLVGVGLDILVITEAGLVPRQAWEVALRPCLSSPGRAGVALINGTPKGYNWFHEFYLKGQDKLIPDIESWNYPSSANPYMDPSEIAKAQKELPERVFRQEYLAEFVADAGIVFRNVDSCIHGELEEPKPGHRYVMGVDLGKHQDFTVICVGEPARGRVVDFDRFGLIDWVLQKERIAATAKKWNGARVWLDSTGVGDPILEDLNRGGVSVEGVHMTASEKKNLVDALSMALEQEKLRYPKIEQLITELKVYEYETTKAGNIRTSAPSGYYDDCVVALALLWKGMSQGSGMPIMCVGGTVRR